MQKTNMTTATAAIKNSVSARAVPSHSDEETTVVTKVGWPPILGVGHHGGDVLLQALVVNGLEGGEVVKILAEGVCDGGVLAENVELDGLGPPVGVSGAATSNIEVRTLALGHCDGL
jgi:hypothetical protein